MSDYGRYGEDTRTRGRGYDRDDYRGRDRDDYRSRNRGWGGGGSIFGSHRDRDRDSDRDDDRWGGGDNRMGGWAGDGRTSDYDRDQRGFGGRDRERGRDRGEHFGRDDRREGLPIDETSRLIASNKVEGTAVYGRDGSRLGSIYNFMVDKTSGRVEYAVMSYGGFLGMGTRYYPLPWRVLNYDRSAGGYSIDMTERDLESAPSFDRNSEPSFNRDYGRRVHDYYGLSY